MESTVAIRDDRLSVLEEKCEALLEHAREVGAEADFHAVRESMDVGRRHGIDVFYRDALGHLETKIAEANRKRINQASRRPFTFVFAPILGFINWIRLR